MKRKIRSIFAAALSVMVLAGCGNKAPEPQVSPAATEYKWEFAMKNTGIDELKTECDQKGSVVSLEYDTPAYAVNDLLGLNETIHKKMSVYLPYNYDESQTYNVLYLLHGTEGDADGPMEDFWLVQWGSETLNVLDNMIKNGLCDPLIVVCPTYYSRVDGHELGDNEAKALAEKRSDSYIYTSEDQQDRHDMSIIRHQLSKGYESNCNVPNDSPVRKMEGDGMRSRIPKDKEPIRKKCHRKRNGPSRGRNTIARNSFIGGHKAGSQV